MHYQLSDNSIYFQCRNFTVCTSVVSALIAVMPPVHSKGSRPDFTGTPRGFRTEKGNAPRHQTKGGKSDFTETPKGKGKGKDQEKERRDTIIEVGHWLCPCLRPFESRISRARGSNQARQHLINEHWYPDNCTQTHSLNTAPTSAVHTLTAKQATTPVRSTYLLHPATTDYDKSSN